MTSRFSNQIWLRRVLFLLILIVAAMFFYLYNVNTPLYADDYSYSFSFYDGSRIDSVKDILLSLTAHYQHMNGRLVTHFFAHLFLMFDKSVFNVANTLIFLTLGLLIYRFSGFDCRTPRPGVLAVIFALLYSEIPDFAESMLWLDASATYHLGTVLILLFLLPYWEHFCHTQNAEFRFPLWLSVLGSILLGFCAGATSENVSLAMLVMLSMILAICFFKKEISC